jgi:RecT family
MNRPTDLDTSRSQSGINLPIARQVFGDERIQVLKDMIAKDCTDAELEGFALVCQRTNLDPFARPPQIYAIKRWDSRLKREVLTPQAAIDSFRLVAARTREYQGQDGPYWCGPDGEWKTIWLSDQPPVAAKVGIFRKGFRHAIWSTALWKESAQYFVDRNTGKKSLGEFWARSPAHMLAKVAECDVLKRAFPNDTQGLELQKIEDEFQSRRHELARKYDAIYGDPDEQRPVLNTHGDQVDPVTGEVLSEPGGEDWPPAEPDDDPRAEPERQQAAF